MLEQNANMPVKSPVKMAVPVEPHCLRLGIKTSLVAQMQKRLFTMRETGVRSLGREDPLLEKEMAIHSSTIAWKISWTEEPGRLQSMGSQSDTTERLHLLTYLPTHPSDKPLPLPL